MQGSHPVMIASVDLIPLQDLKRQHRVLAKSVRGVFERVTESGWFILGNEVAQLELEFARYIGAKEAVAVANGTDALELALRALGVGRGDSVVLVANAGFYGSASVMAVGGNSIFVDVDPKRLTLDPEMLVRALREPAKAIIVTHLYGQMAEMPKILSIAQTRGVPVVEDCAQAHGASINGKCAGTWGALGCFSFYPTKNLGALGDAGMVVTSDVHLSERVRMLRQYGWKNKYEIRVAGGRNSRMDELQAAILRMKLPHLPEWNSRRRVVAEQYNKAFATLDITLPEIEGDSYVAHLYVVRTTKRAHLKDRLEKDGIQTQIHYPIPDYRQPIFGSHPNKNTCLKVTEDACSQVLSLPCFPELESEEVSRVISSVHKAFLKN